MVSGTSFHWVGGVIGLAIIATSCGEATKSDDDRGNGAGGQAGAAAGGGSADGGESGAPTGGTSGRGGAGPGGEATGGTDVGGRGGKGGTTGGEPGGGEGGDDETGGTTSTGGVGTDGGIGGDGGVGGDGGIGGDGGVGGHGGKGECSDAWTLSDFDDLESVEEAEAVLLRDIDRDQRLDLVALSLGSAVVVRQQNDGTLSPPTPYSTLIMGLTAGETGALGDFDRDGYPDLVVATYADVRWLRNDGQGGFLAVRQLGERTPPVNIPYERILLEDVDDDGFLDAALQTSGFVDLYYGNGSGGIRNKQTIVGSFVVHDFTLADVNADGMLDIVMLEYDGDLFAYEQENGAFLPARIIAPIVFTDFSWSLEAGDIDSDGINDLVASGRDRVYDAGIAVFHARDEFEVPQRLAGYYSPLETRIADLDGNGQNDVVVVHSGYERVEVYRQCEGQLQAGRLFRTPYVSNRVRNSIAVGDIDGDGCSDVVLAHSISGAFALYGRNCTR